MKLWIETDEGKRFGVRAHTGKRQQVWSKKEFLSVGVTEGELNTNFCPIGEAFPRADIQYYNPHTERLYLQRTWETSGQSML